jgi:hypothetical protein
MSTVKCGEWSNELAESARRGAGPSEGLSAHLSDCGRCGERWEAERTLSAELRRLRLAHAGERSQDVWRRRLMAEFAPLERSQSRSWFRWAWVPASVALLVVASVQVWLGMPGRNVPAQLSVESEDFAGAGFLDIDEENGFIPVPYALPLATGESVRIVRRELNGAELVRMGIDLPGGYAGGLADDFEADIVLGEDELPRAVQLVSYPELRFQTGEQLQ